MGVDISIRVYHYNEEENKWHRLQLFRQNEKTGEVEEVYIYNGRNTEMFNALQNQSYDDNYGEFPCHSVRWNSLDENEREELKKYQDTFGYYGFSEVSLYAMKAYLNEHPQVKDYDEDWETDKEGNLIPQYCDNPIASLYKEIIYFIDFASYFGLWNMGEYENYKVIYFFDC